MNVAKDFIGRLLISSPEQQARAFEAVSPTDISDRQLRRIFLGAKASWEKHGEVKTVDMIGNPGDWSVATEATANTPFGITVEDWAPRIVREGMQSKVKDLGTILQAEPDPERALHLADVLISELLSQREEKNNTPRAVWARIQAKVEANKERRQIGLPTPFHKLTEYTSGFRLGHLWIVGGYTSHGKSFLGVEFAYHVLKQGGKVILFSTEMDVETFMLRIAARHSGIHSTRILLGDMTEIGRQAVDESFALMDAYGLILYDDVYAIEQMRIKAKRDKAHWEGKLDLVVVDFVQNIIGEGTVYERMARVAIELQRMAKDLNACVIALSQISNESARNDSDLLGYKGAGEIAAAADVGLWIKRDNERMDLYVRKNRHGKTGKVALRFTANWTRLEEIGEET